MVNKYRNISFCDFEFVSRPGERPEPVCMVVLEFYTGRCHRYWQDDLTKMDCSPIPGGKEDLSVAYYAPAEMNCYLALGWRLPENLVDLYAEFRNATNGRQLSVRRGLLGAQQYYGLKGLDAAEKDSMRNLIMQGGPWSKDEQSQILDYCESDVRALYKLWPEMRPEIYLPKALIRGAYMKAVASMEHHGIPIDQQTFIKLQENWQTVKQKLITAVDKDFGIYNNQSFKMDRFSRWLEKNDYYWPRLPSGYLDLKRETFKSMSCHYPEILPLHELRKTLSSMNEIKLTVGSDGRNRCMLSPFSSLTSRNQPSTTKFIFGVAKWLRCLIKPPTGYALIYLDYSQQEFGIAAALSDDPLMKAAYLTGDSYLAFAKQAGAVPDDATKQSHPLERKLYKSCGLGVLYGMGTKALASRIQQPEARVIDLLKTHHRTYKEFWEWAEGVLNYALLRGKIYTTFGWTQIIGHEPNPRSIINFPMQSNAAEMLRLFCIKAMNHGIKICAPIHDAVLIETPIEKIESTLLMAQSLMAEASADVLDGFQLRTTAKIIKYPDRFMDEDGKEMWQSVMDILSKITD